MTHGSKAAKQQSSAGHAQDRTLADRFPDVHALLKRAHANPHLLPAPVAQAIAFGVTSARLIVTMGGDPSPTMRTIAEALTPYLPCDHCDGEGTEVTMGPDGYFDGPCTHCEAHA